MQVRSTRKGKRPSSESSDHSEAQEGQEGQEGDQDKVGVVRGVVFSLYTLASPSLLPPLPSLPPPSLSSFLAVAVRTPSIPSNQ